MRILIRNNQRLEWVTRTWMQLAIFSILTLVPLFFGFITLLEGELAAAVIPIIVSVFGIVLYAFFVGVRTVVLDRETGRITVKFRSMLRHKIEEGILDDLSDVLVCAELGENPTEIVDPNSRRSKRTRYKALAKFDDGSELSLTGAAKIGDEAHRAAQTVLSWLGNLKDNESDDRGSHLEPYQQSLKRRWGVCLCL